MLKKVACRWFLLSFVIIVCDQWSKYLIVQNFGFNQIKVVFSFLNITLRYNAGAAFSFLNAGGWQYLILIGVPVIVSMILCIWLYRVSASEKLLSTGLSLILGGAVGNLIDRIRFGYVTDFIDFHIRGWHFATFNVADAAVTIGAALLIYQFFISSKKSDI